MWKEHIKKYKIIALVFLGVAVCLAAFLTVWLGVSGWNIFSLGAPLLFFLLLFLCGVCLLVACLCFVKVMRLSYEQACMINCPACGQPNVETNAYCSACGAKLKERIEK